MSRAAGATTRFVYVNFAALGLKVAPQYTDLSHREITTATALTRLGTQASTIPTRTFRYALLIALRHALTDVPTTSNGSYYYQNTNGSTYYNSGAGSAQYTSPSGYTYKSSSK